MCPPTVLLRIEFTASDSLQPMGELLPRLSTLTSSSAQVSHPLARRKRQASLVSLRLLSPPDPRVPRWAPAGARWNGTRRYISVALFLKSPSAGVTRYPCPVEPGLSSQRAFRPRRATACFTRHTILQELGAVVNESSQPAGQNMFVILPLKCYNNTDQNCVRRGRGHMTLEEYLGTLAGKTVAVIGVGVSNTPLIRLLRGAGSPSPPAIRRTGRPWVLWRRSWRP